MKPITGFDLFDVPDEPAAPEARRPAVGDHFVAGSGPTWIVTVAESGASGCVMRAGTKGRKWYGYLFDASSQTAWIYPINGCGERTGPDVTSGVVRWKGAK